MVLTGRTCGRTPRGSQRSTKFRFQARRCRANKTDALEEKSERFRHVSVLEALQAQLQAVSPGPIGLPVHHRRHRLRVLHDHRHLAVPLSQHAPVVDVGRACGRSRASAGGAAPRQRRGPEAALPMMTVLSSAMSILLCT